MPKLDCTLLTMTRPSVLDGQQGTFHLGLQRNSLGQSLGIRFVGAWGSRRIAVGEDMEHFGLLRGDCLVSLNGVKPKTPEECQYALRRLMTVNFVFQRHPSRLAELGAVLDPFEEEEERGTGLCCRRGTDEEEVTVNTLPGPSPFAPMPQFGSEQSSFTEALGDREAAECGLVRQQAPHMMLGPPDSEPGDFGLAREAAMPSERQDRPSNILLEDEPQVPAERDAGEGNPPPEETIAPRNELPPQARAAEQACAGVCCMATVEEMATVDEHMDDRKAGGCCMAPAKEVVIVEEVASPASKLRPKGHWELCDCRMII